MATVAGVPVMTAVVLGVEVLVAINAPQLPATEPYRLTIAGEESARHVVWLGDSTAAGVGASSAANSVPHVVAARSAEPVDLTVLAVSGAKVGDVLTEQLPQMSSLQPDIVYISIGANDVNGLTSRSDFRRRYTQMLQTIPGDVTVVVLGIPDMGSVPRFAQPLRAIAGWRGRQLGSVVREAAAARHVSYVDIAAKTGPAYRQNPGRYFSDDNFHPNDAGYELWAGAVVERTALPTGR